MKKEKKKKTPSSTTTTTLTKQPENISHTNNVLVLVQFFLFFLSSHDVMSSSFSAFKFMSMFIHFMEIFLVAHTDFRSTSSVGDGAPHFCNKRSFVVFSQTSFILSFVTFCCSITQLHWPSGMSWLDLLHCNTNISKSNNLIRSSKREMNLKKESPAAAAANIVVNKETCKFKNFKLFVGFVKW